MTESEQFQTALIRVRGGATFRTIVREVYTSWPRYRELCSGDQRKQLKAVRLEYLAAKRAYRQMAGRKRRHRITFATNADLKKELVAHCKGKGISIGYFINKALSKELRRIKEES